MGKQISGLFKSKQKERETKIVIWLARQLPTVKKQKKEERRKESKPRTEGERERERVDLIWLFLVE